jgi:hypothetical protein
MEMSLQGLETCPVKDNFPAYTRCSTIVPSALAMLAMYPVQMAVFWRPIPLVGGFSSSVFYRYQEIRR